MKRVHVENWSTREKLALGSSVLRSGDQNWVSVSRLIRVFGESSRPPDWFSQKQCAVQYDVLLNTVSTSKRKKRSEKGVDINVDTPGEMVVRKLTQERIDELKVLLMDSRMQYLKEKRELEEINNGRLDDRLGEIMQQMEQSEANEKEEQAAMGALRQWEERKLDIERPPPPYTSVRTKLENSGSENVQMEVEVKPTSPLLTSLLQSPSPVLLHRNAGPTISSLLHSAPAVPRTPQPPSLQQHAPTTLSKLLESPTIAAAAASVLPESTMVSSSPSRSIAPPATSHASSSGQIVLHETIKAEEDMEVNIKVELEDIPIVKDISSTIIANAERPDAIAASETERIVRQLKSEFPPVLQTTPSRQLPLQLGQGASESTPVVSDLNRTPDSDIINETLSELAELDSHTVEMIVVGPNQAGLQVKEELVEISSTDIDLVTEGKLDIIADDVIVSDEEVPGDKVHVDVVKDLGEVTASEMKEIIEGAEVIVGELIENEAREAAKEKEQASDNVSIESAETDVCSTPAAVEPVLIETPEKSGPKVELATSEDTSGAVDAETVVDDGVIVDNIVDFDDTIVEVSEAETMQDVVVNEEQAKSTDICTDPKTDSSSAMNVSEMEGNLKKVENEGNYQIQQPAVEEAEKSVHEEMEPESIIEEDTQESTTVTDAVVTEVLTLATAASALVNVTPGTSTPTTPTVITPDSILATGIAPHVASEIVMASRPDTPSTEEDNEPVANLVKKIAAKKSSIPAAAGISLPSDSVPNSPVSNSAAEDGASYRAWKKSIMLVYNRLATHKYASLFLRPITDEQARGYHSVIHRPMDLSTIKKNVETGVLRTTVEFQRDMMLMFQNAIMYNNSVTLVYEMASEMQGECIQHLQLMVEAMGEGVPLRGEAVEVDGSKTRARGSKSDNKPVRMEQTETRPSHEPPLPRKRKRTSVAATDNQQVKKRKAEET